MGDITPASVSAAISTARGTGTMYDLFTIYKHILVSDTDVAGAFQNRFLGAMGLPEELQTPDGATIPDEIMDFVRDYTLDAPYWSTLGEDILDAVAMGYSVIECVPYIGQWKGQYRNLINPTYRDQRLFRWDINKYYTLVYAGVRQDKATPLGPQFLVNKYRSLSKRPADYGVLHTLLWNYLFKRMTLTEQIIFTRKFGGVMPVGKYQEGATSENKSALRTVIEKWSAGNPIVIPENCEIEIRDHDRSGSIAVFTSLVELMRKGIWQAITGNSLMAENFSTGSKANSESGVGIMEKFIIADCRQLLEPAKNRFIKLLVDMNYGPQDAYPRISYITEQKQQAPGYERLAIYRDLIAMGLPISVDSARRDFVIEAPTPDAELLHPIIGAPAGAGREGGGGGLPPTTPGQPPTGEPPPAGKTARPFDNGGKAANGDTTLSTAIDSAPIPPPFELCACDELSDEDFVTHFANEITNNPRAALSILKQNTAIKNLARSQGDKWQSARREAVKSVLAGAESWSEVKTLAEEKTLDLAFHKPQTEILYATELAANRRGIAHTDTYLPPDAKAFRAADEPVSPGKKWRMQFVPKEALEYWQIASYAVGDYENQALWQGVKNAVQRAIENGDSFYTFRDNLNRELEGIAEFGQGRAYSVYHTNVMTSYSAGKFAEQAEVSDILEGVEFTAVMDDATRVEHAALDGMQTEFGSEEHVRYMTPLDYNCRCDWLPIMDYKRSDFGGNFAPPFSGIPGTGLAEWVDSELAAGVRAAAKKVLTSPDGIPIFYGEQSPDRIEAAFTDAREARGWLNGVDSVKAYIGPKYMLVTVNATVYQIYEKSRPKYTGGVKTWQRE